MKEDEAFQFVKNTRTFRPFLRIIRSGRRSRFGVFRFADERLVEGKEAIKCSIDGAREELVDARKYFGLDTTCVMDVHNK